MTTQVLYEETASVTKAHRIPIQIQLDFSHHKGYGKI
jgi:hypothetical protein